MYAMCLAHFCDQSGFSFTRPGIPFAVRCELSAARIVPDAAPLPAAAAPAAASAATTRLRRVVRIGAYLIGAKGRRLYSRVFEVVRGPAHRGEVGSGRARYQPPHFG